MGSRFQSGLFGGLFHNPSISPFGADTVVSLAVTLVRLATSTPDPVTERTLNQS